MKLCILLFIITHSKDKRVWSLNKSKITHKKFYY
jgi:hypothetical protein